MTSAHDGLVVVGVGRSGTSIAARMLADLGLRIPLAAELLPANYANPTGYFESAALARLDDELLAMCGASWWQPPIDLDDDDLTLLEPHRERARTAFRDAYGTEPGWVWKEPRLTILLPFWDGVLDQQPVLIPIRDAAEVAASICRRDGLTAPQALAVWERHTRSLLAAVVGRPALVLDYATLCQNPLEWQRAAREFCAAVGIEVSPETRSDHRVVPARCDRVVGMSDEQHRLQGVMRELIGAHACFPVVDRGVEDESNAMLIKSISPPAWAR